SNERRQPTLLTSSIPYPELHFLSGYPSRRIKGIVPRRLFRVGKEIRVKNSYARKCMIAATLLVPIISGLANGQTAGNSPYRVSGGTGTVHIYPTPELSRQIKAQQGANTLGVLTYQGGPIMTGETLYAIFWIPPTLQNGHSTTLSSKYQTVTKQFLGDYPDHGIANNSTQYYSTTSGTKYFVGKGAFAGFYLDTNPYPSSGCSDTVTPGNCITEAQ